MLTLKLSGVVVCLRNGNRSMQKFVIVSQLSSFVLFLVLVFFGVECGHHKWGGPGPSFCACPGPTYVHLGPCGNQILIMKFYKNKI
jgi:hypothetical protein